MGLGQAGALHHRRAGADVATLALAGDTDALHANGGWIAKDWQKRLPHNSAPYTSTIVLVVRQGNNQGYPRLGRPRQAGHQRDHAQPQDLRRRAGTPGGLGVRQAQDGGDAKAKEFVAKLYANVPVLDTGARGSSVTFCAAQPGDVFISWENEAYLLEKEFGSKVDVVYPSLSILAEPAVTVVDKNADRKGTRAVAEAYLKYLYTEEGQDIVGRHFYRPAISEGQGQVRQTVPRAAAVSPSMPPLVVGKRPPRTTSRTTPVLTRSIPKNENQIGMKRLSIKR